MYKLFYFFAASLLAIPSHAQFGQLLSQLESNLHELSNIVEKMPAAKVPAEQIEELELADWLKRELEALPPEPHPLPANVDQKILQELKRLQKENKKTKYLLSQVGVLPVVNYPDGKYAIVEIEKLVGLEFIKVLEGAYQKTLELEFPGIEEVAHSFISREYPARASNSEAVGTFKQNLKNPQKTKLLLSNFSDANYALYVIAMDADSMRNHITNYYTKHMASMDPELQTNYLGRIKLDAIKNLINASSDKVKIPIQKAQPDGSFESQASATINMYKTTDPFLNLVSCYFTVRENPSQLTDDYFFVCPAQVLKEQPDFQKEIEKKAQELKQKHNVLTPMSRISLVPIITEQNSTYILLERSEEEATDFELPNPFGGYIHFMSLIQEFARSSTSKELPAFKTLLTEKLYDPKTTRAVVQAVDIYEKSGGMHTDNWVTFFMKFNETESDQLKNILTRTLGSYYKKKTSDLKSIIEKTRQNLIPPTWFTRFDKAEGRVLSLDNALVAQLRCYFTCESQNTYICSCAT